MDQFEDEIDKYDEMPEFLIKWLQSLNREQAKHLWLWLDGQSDALDKIDEHLEWIHVTPS